MIDEQKIADNIATVVNTPSIFRQIGIYIVVLAVGIGLGMFFQYKIMNPQLQNANNLVAQYDQRIKSLQTDKETALVENAKLKLKEPEKLYVQGETKTEYVYREKQSASDPDVNVTDAGQEIKIAYNGQTFNLPMKQTTNTAGVKNGTLNIGQHATATLDVTDVVKREVANVIMQKDSEIEKLKHEKEVTARQGKQNAFWGTFGGAVTGYIGGRLHK